MLKFVVDLEVFLRSNFSGYPADSTLVAEACPEGQTGDFTLNCFKLAKFCGNPQQLAAKVADFLNSHEDVESAEAVKAFVNVSLKSSALYRDTIADLKNLLDDGLVPDSERR